MKVVVVGGSIGGLSAAAALLKNGVDAKDVTVLERAAKIVPAGAVSLLIYCGAALGRFPNSVEIF